MVNRNRAAQQRPIIPLTRTEGDKSARQEEIDSTEVLGGSLHVSYYEGIGHFPAPLADSNSPPPIMNGTANLDPAQARVSLPERVCVTDSAIPPPLSSLYAKRTFPRRKKSIDSP